MHQRETAWLLKEKYHGEKTDGFFADCARLEAGEPLAYIIGAIPFLNCTISLESRPLIPRPETEYWVEEAINSIKAESSMQDREPERDLASSRPSLCVLDLCAGSGAIGVAVAKAIPEASVTFAEIDENHLPTIKKNLAENTTIYSSITHPIIASDLFANVTGVFDFILTNPPYIDAHADTVEADVVAHEPHLALFGGIGGMEVITRIITEAPTRLSPTGQLWIEHEPFQKDAIASLADIHRFTVSHHTDQYGTVRYSVLSLRMAE